MIKFIKPIRIFLTFFSLAFLIHVPKSYALPAEQPKTNYNVNIYSQMITGWIADQNLEIIPEGQLGIPNTMIVLNEKELNGAACDTSDPTSCDKIAHVQYPQQNDREEDIEVSGQCQKSFTLDPDSTKGRCKFDQSKDYSIEFVGTDTSGADGLTIPGTQSYNHMYTSDQCGGKKNVLNYGSHDLILPANIQTQLRLSLLWRAFSTWYNYQKDNNPKKELPVGGINWKEKIVVNGEEIELIDVYNHKLPGYMKPACYKNIWETELDPNNPPLDRMTQAEADEIIAGCTSNKMPPVPAFLENSTWLTKSNYFYKLAKKNKEDWVKYFDCTPLYPSHTNAPALSIGSLVLALGSKGDPSGMFNIALHDATLVDNFAARASTEGKIVETAFLNNAETGREILKDLGKKIPLVANYFEEARADVPHMPTALVFGNDNTSATSDMAASGDTVTLFKPLTTHQFGSVLDYPNRLYNPITNPAPRMPKVSKEDFEKQDAMAVYDTTTILDDIKNAFSIPKQIFLKLIPNKQRRYMIGESWSQAGRFLEKPSVSILMPSTELAKDYLTKNNNINVVVNKDGGLDGISERLSNSIKLNNSAFLACKSDYRFDFSNTPRMIAEGTAINSCGQPTSTTESSITCKLDISDEKAVDSALNIAASKASKATGIPANWLIAISKIEGGTSLLGDKCVKKPGNPGLGPMQLGDSEYNIVTCEEERIGLDSTACERSSEKLSRCNLEDSLLLAGRLLLFKLGKFPNSCKTPAANNIPLKELYNATNNYYQTCLPTETTSAWNVPGVNRTPNYSDIVCNLAGQSSVCNTLPQCP